MSQIAFQLGQLLAKQAAYGEAHMVPTPPGGLAPDVPLPDWGAPPSTSLFDTQPGHTDVVTPQHATTQPSATQPEATVPDLMGPEGLLGLMRSGGKAVDTLGQAASHGLDATYMLGGGLAGGVAGLGLGGLLGTGLGALGGSLSSEKHRVRNALLAALMGGTLGAGIGGIGGALGGLHYTAAHPLVPGK